MSEKDGHQVIACNVSSCKHFHDNLCELAGIEVGAQHNATNGIAEDETLCSSYEKRENPAESMMRAVEEMPMID